jgi:hypothetical protein
MSAYEHALHANPNSVPAMNAISLILRTREEFGKAVDYLQAILKIDDRNGEVWGSLGMFQFHGITGWSLDANALRRTLLSHDGRSATGICRLPECLDQPPQSQGLFPSFTGLCLNCC